MSVLQNKTIYIQPAKRSEIVDGEPTIALYEIGPYKITTVPSVGDTVRYDVNGPTYKAVVAEIIHNLSKDTISLLVIVDDE